MFIAPKTVVVLPGQLSPPTLDCFLFRHLVAKLVERATTMEKFLAPQVSVKIKKRHVIFYEMLRHLPADRCPSPRHGQEHPTSLLGPSYQSKERTMLPVSLLVSWNSRTLTDNVFLETLLCHFSNSAYCTYCWDCHKTWRALLPSRHQHVHLKERTPVYILT